LSTSIKQYKKWKIITIVFSILFVLISIIASVGVSIDHMGIRFEMIENEYLTTWVYGVFVFIYAIFFIVLIIFINVSNMI
jgi:hypothetical protein